METKPTLIGAPNYRCYDDYKYGATYAKGWNDAMRFIFGIAETELKKRPDLKVIKGGNWK